MTPTVWFGQVDANSAVLLRPGDNFAPHPAATPAMSVVVDAGFVVGTTPAGAQIRQEAAQQTVAIAAAPGAPNNRIDLVVVDAGTGVASVITGTPATTPGAPPIGAGKLPIALVAIPNGTAAISASAITDIRAVWSIGMPGVPWAVGGGTADVITATYLPSNATTGLYDGLLLAVRAPGANTSTAPTFAPDGLTAHPITKRGGAALLAGDIPGNLSEILLRFNAAYARWELLHPVAQSSIPWAIAGGTANALTASFSGSPAMVDGLLLSLRVNVANTGAATLNVGGAGAYAILKRGTSPVVAGDIAQYSEMIVRLNNSGSSPIWEFINAPSVPTAAQIDAALGFTPAPASQIGGFSSFVSAATNVNASMNQVIQAVGTGSVDVQLPAPSIPGGTVTILTQGFGGSLTVTCASGNVVYGVLGVGFTGVTGYETASWCIWQGINPLANPATYRFVSDGGSYWYCF